MYAHMTQSSWEASRTCCQGIQCCFITDDSLLARPGLVLVMHHDDLCVPADAAILMLRCSCACRTQSFSDNVTRVPGGDCWVVGDGAWRAGQELVFVLHDDDWFAAALDLDMVQQLSIVDSSVDKLSIAPHLYALAPAGSPTQAAPAPSAGSGYRSGVQGRVGPEDGGEAVPAAPAPWLPARSV